MCLTRVSTSPPILSPEIYLLILSKSIITYLACIALLLTGGLIYYPKWKLDRTEATISWDVSGYYYYLPAFLIYHDAKRLAWHDDILNRYYPAPGDQAYLHPGGNMVMKYSSGLALQYLPFFLIADLITPLTSHPADGFSRPYQLAISLGSLLIACLGLWLLRLVLRTYFSDGVVAITLVTIAFATNYLDYASINHAMTHNYLFTLYAALLLFTSRYWTNQKISTALMIGLLTGLIALTRPSEAIAILLPILWGVGSKSAMLARVKFFRQHWKHLFAATCAFAVMGMLQIVYWKYATGDWIVYSYQDQGFSWLSPHILNGLFSYRAGWLIYTPVMVFSLIGFYFLWRKNNALFYPLCALAVLSMYVTWAWDIWWYGGSLGQRSMVQLYPVLAFPLAACIERIVSSKPLRIAGMFLLALCIYYNLWLTHQAHHGGLLRAGDMTKAYFWKILGKYQVEEDAQFLLDSDEWYQGMRNGVEIVSEDFEKQDSSLQCPIAVISGSKSACVGPQNEFVALIRFTIPENTQWLRATATFRCTKKEWDTWKMAQFRVHLLKGDEMVKTQVIRVYRALHDGETQRFSVDLRIPRDADFDQGGVDLWNAGSDTSILMDDLTVTAF